MDDRQFEEMYQLTKENNRMLHAMRRGAFWGGLFKLVMYAVFLILPLWFYMTYLNSSVQQMLAAVNKVEGTSAAAQTQLNGFQQAWQQFESHLPGFSPASSTTQ